MDWQVNDFVQEVNALIAQYRNSSRQLYRALLGFDGGNVMIFNVVPLTVCLIFGKIEDSAVVEKSGEEFLRKWASSLRLNPEEGIDLPQLQLPSLESQAGPLPVLAALSSGPATHEAAAGAEPEPLASPAVMAPPPAALLPEDPVTGTPPASPSPGPLAPTVEPPPVALSEEVLPVNRAENWASFRQRVENLLSKVLGRAQAAKLIDRELAAMGITGNAFLNSAQFRPFGQRLISKVKDKSVRRLLETEMISHVEDHCD